MIRALTAIFVLATGWSWTGLGLDKLRWNERERSEAGIESLKDGRASEAVEAFETATRLDPENPLLRFNAGSAHLANQSEGAIPHLEHAAEFATGEIAAPANYNLGNARLAAGDPAGAIEAYEQALRSQPSHQAAKFNLELALRRQQQEQEQDQEQEQEPQDQGEPSPNQQEPDPNDEGQPPPQPPENQDPQDQESSTQDPGPQEEGEGNDQLPRFEEQPDMTAEQAAAILEAVENLEREQRRKQAAEEMKKRPRKGKDW